MVLHEGIDSCEDSSWVVTESGLVQGLDVRVERGFAAVFELVGVYVSAHVIEEEL